MRQLILILGMLLLPVGVFAGEIVKGTCSFYTGGQPSNYCQCQIKEDPLNPDNTHLVLVQCDLLQCSDYEQGREPASCKAPGQN